MRNRFKAALLSIVLNGAVASAEPALIGSKGRYIITEYIDSSPQHAWEILTDFKLHQKLAPDIAQVQIWHHGNGILHITNTYKALYTFGLPIKARLAIKKTSPKGFSYSLVQSDHLKSLKGEWTILPLTSGVKLQHKIWIEPIMPVGLRPFYYQKQEESLKRWMETLKKEIESQ